MTAVLDERGAIEKWARSRREGVEMSFAMTLDPGPSTIIPGRRAAASSRPQWGAPDRAAVPTRVDRDGPLVEGLRRGEPAAAERLVATYGDRAYRLAIGITGTVQDAEEVVQDAF